MGNRSIIPSLIGLGTYFGISMARKMILKGSKEDTEEVAINTTSDTFM
jgi:hypothetical protein